jgi:hypothetical protein
MTNDAEVRRLCDRVNPDHVLPAKIMGLADRRSRVCSRVTMIRGAPSGQPTGKRGHALDRVPTVRA